MVWLQKWSRYRKPDLFRFILLNIILLIINSAAPPFYSYFWFHIFFFLSLFPVSCQKHSPKAPTFTRQPPPVQNHTSLSPFLFPQMSKPIQQRDVVHFTFSVELFVGGVKTTLLLSETGSFILYLAAWTTSLPSVKGEWIQHRSLASMPPQPK